MYEWLKTARYSIFLSTATDLKKKLQSLQNRYNSTIFTFLVDGWANGKNVSMSVSKLFQVTEYNYRVFGSC